jgi:hypothetical protein
MEMRMKNSCQVTVRISPMSWLGRAGSSGIVPLTQCDVTDNGIHFQVEDKNTGTRPARVWEGGKGLSACEKDL